MFAGHLLLAQLPVSTQPQNKKVLLEHFYGFKCLWSPQGDSISESIAAAHPTGAITIVNIHSYYANPSPGWPDYVSPEGKAIFFMPGMNCPGIPAGPINRHLWYGKTGLAMDRSYWKKYSDSILVQPAYVNIALQGTLDVKTRVLTVTTEIYYTGSSPAPTNSLNIMVLEDSVVGPQIDHMYKKNWNSDGTYNHHYMLRQCVTPSLGLTIPTTTVGTFHTQTFTCVIPKSYGLTYTNSPKLENMRLVGFVAQSDREVQNVAGGSIKLTGFADSLDLGLTAITGPKLICSSLSGIRYNFINYGSAVVTTAVFLYNVNNGAVVQHTWSGTVKPLKSIQIDVDPSLLSGFALLTSNTVHVDVASVNGAYDQNSQNDHIEGPGIGLTTYETQDEDLNMFFSQDQFGSECKWEIFDEVTNQLIASDGPWSNLTFTGTMTHVKSVTVSPYNCYKLVVSDSKKNGINGGFGAGHYELKHASQTILSSQGIFGSSEIKPFRVWGTVGLTSAVLPGSFKVFPSPAADLVNLRFGLNQNEHVRVAVYNSSGQKIFVKEPEEFSSGEHEMSFEVADWATGIYFFHVITPNSVSRQTLVVSR